MKKTPFLILTFIVIALPLLESILFDVKGLGLFAILGALCVGQGTIEIIQKSNKNGLYFWIAGLVLNRLYNTVALLTFYNLPTHWLSLGLYLFSGILFCLVCIRLALQLTASLWLNFDQYSEGEKRQKHAFWTMYIGGEVLMAIVVLSAIAGLLQTLTSGELNKRAFFIPTVGITLAAYRYIGKSTLRILSPLGLQTESQEFEKILEEKVFKKDMKDTVTMMTSIWHSDELNHVYSKEIAKNPQDEPDLTLLYKRQSFLIKGIDLGEAWAEARAQEIVKESLQTCETSDAFHLLKSSFEPLLKKIPSLLVHFEAHEEEYISNPKYILNPNYKERSTLR